MDTCVLGVIISREEYDEYIKLKQKNTPMKKRKIYGQRNFHCPSCNYVVDNIVPKQYYAIDVDKDYIRGGIRKNRRI